jgi:DNA-binding CsgD family transcriptional regulator
MLAEALDILDYALLIVDEDARIGFKNRAAARVLQESQALQETDGTLTVRPRALSQQVTSAIQCASTNGITSLRIPKADGSQRPLGLIFTPMVRRVAIWIVDTESPASANERLLGTLFGLSRAESRLALGLVAGQTAEEYARQAGVGIATVRSQLHSIFGKTGTRRQAGLVALLCKLPALKLPTVTAVPAVGLSAGISALI